MKKLRFIYLIGLFIFVISSCDKNDDLVVDSPESSSNLKSMDVDINACNDSPTVFELIAGQHINVGEVSIVNDEENLYVTYETEGEWMLQEVHVFVGDLDDLPVNKKNTPIPGHFPYKDEGLYLNSYTTVIPLSEIGSDCFVIFTHAVVVKEEGIDDEGETIWSDETAWGCGGFDFEEVLGTTRWGCFGEYCVEECVDEEKYLIFKTFTTDSWSFITEGEHFFTADECALWGAVDPEVEGTYNLRANGKWDIIAVASIIIVENDAILTITTTDNGILQNTFWFYGTEEEIISTIDGDCPNYSGFPNPVTEDGSIHEIIIPL